MAIPKLAGSLFCVAAHRGPPFDEYVQYTELDEQVNLHHQCRGSLNTELSGSSEKQQKAAGMDRFNRGWHSGSPYPVIWNSREPCDRGSQLVGRSTARERKMGRPSQDKSILSRERLIRTSHLYEFFKAYTILIQAHICTSSFPRNIRSRGPQGQED